MGSGIAQIAAQNGSEVVLVDTAQEAVDKAKTGHQKILARLVEKERLKQGEDDEILARINYTINMDEIAGSDLVIEAIVEDMNVKKKVFARMEELCDENTILASNTSSLSIASIGSSVKKSDRVVGIHFFNPAPLMPLVCMLGNCTATSLAERILLSKPLA